MTTLTTLYPSCLLSAILIIFFNLPCKVIAQQGRPKILALHGGGGTGSSFAYYTNQLAGALPEYEFIYADAGYSCGSGCKLWISDPPGGKGQPTTDPAFSDDSIHALDQILENQGPFVGILGYSQGAAYVPVYLSRVPEGTFSFAVMFCGYLTETHRGILDVVEEQSPFGDIPALVWMGVNDFIISNAQTTNQAGIFTSPTVITDNNAGHVVPGTSESTFTDVVSFISSFSVSSPTPTSSPNGTTSSSPSASPGAPTAPTPTAPTPTAPTPTAPTPTAPTPTAPTPTAPTPTAPTPTAPTPTAPTPTAPTPTAPTPTAPTPTAPTPTAPTPTAPTPTAPTPTAPTPCTDSNVRFRLNWNGRFMWRYCTWVAKAGTKRKCAVDGVSAMCADTCRTCSSCQDSTLRMKLSYNGVQSRRSCSWVAKRRTVERCALDGVAYACRSTCGEC